MTTRGSRKRNTKTATDTPATPAPPPKAQQPHGGAIYTGGVPGHRGGSGRPPKLIKELLLGNLEAVAPRIHERVMAGLDVSQLCPSCGATPTEANDLALRYLATLQQKTLSSEKEVTMSDVTEKVTRTVALLKAELQPVEFKRLDAQLRAIWTGR